MRICSFKIKNYKSFLEPRELTLEEGFNLIVGQNNVGKTALLEALSLKFLGKPHRSQLTASTPTSIINPTSSALVKLAASGAELRELLLECGEFYVPIRADFPISEQDGNRALKEILSRDETHFTLGLQASLNNPAGWIIINYPTHGLYPTATQFFRLNPLPDKTGFNVLGTMAADQANDFGVQVAAILSSRIYRFDAQRVGLGSCGFGNNAVLHPTASNLPEVLNILQNNAPLVQDFNELIHRIFPSIVNDHLKFPPVRSREIPPSR